MGRRAKRAARCEVCRLQIAQCLCAEVPRLQLGTRVVVVMHHREVSKTTATGPLALRALPNSELHVHGARDAPLDLTALHGQGRRVLLLFPGDDARTLTPALLAEDPRPVTLVVPDGSWRQASRAARRIPGLAQAEPVTLAEGAPSAYRLRREPREGGLATFEAIARALGILESAEAQAGLERLFALMVERTLATRGRPEPPPGPAPEAPLEIIYRDEDLVAVNKPAGMLVHRGLANDARPALQVLRDQLGRHVYPVHRLDRGTSGVLLFAFSGAVARLVQAQLVAHEVEKRYLALCRGHDPALVRVDHPLAKEEGGERRPAVTDFKLLGQWERYGLYEARPHQGRLHQIRRHLKHASHPVIGDARYGKGEHNRLFRERFGFHRLALHASDLDLRHPRTGAPLHLHARLPPELARLLTALGLDAKSNP
jgi:RluA family pseudouridine synthase